MSKQIIKIESCIPKVGKSGKPHHKCNNKYFIFEKDIGRQFEDNIGKTYEVEIDDSTEFHKIRQIYGESTEDKIETVNMTQPVEKMQAINELGYVPKGTVKAILKEELTLIRDKPNSRTYGKGADSIKIYFDTAESLSKQIDELIAMNLMSADYDPHVEKEVDFTDGTKISKKQ